MKTLSKGRGKMPITAAAFPCWMATERPCRRNCKERGSPVSALISFTPAERGRKWPQAQIYPVVSMAMDREEMVTGAEKAYF